MSGAQACEVCGLVGRRANGALCPDGWTYAEVADEDGDSCIIVVAACSDACRAAFWKPGPGHLPSLVVAKPIETATRYGAWTAAAYVGEHHGERLWQCVHKDGSMRLLNETQIHMIRHQEPTEAKGP